MSPPSASATQIKTSQALYDLAMDDDEGVLSEDMPQDGRGTVIAERYVLKAVLGEGASGFVWHAEQTTPVRRDVAVKIIRHGLVTESVSTRFNREHQVLARVEHPNIAAVFDAGELPDGRTFFVMELVDGMPVTKWCKHHGASVRARLEIFLQACRAVHHAHQKGILHRDLKPSNVLVTTASDKPLVKVIDFGIAKALSADLVAGADVTLRGMVLGTPRYMSPEQAGLTGQQVDARTDVFTLGVLLYELLTGTTPILGDEEQSTTLPDILQRVRHTEAERPSRRVARAALADLPPLTSPRRLARQLSGDLDWILLRALQTDREQRYPSVIAMADDVRCHLQDEPVSAGPPGVAYQLKKWSTRHRSMLTGAAAVVSVSLAGAAATWWALDGEQTQRLEAQQQRQRAAEEGELAKTIGAQLAELLLNARKHADAGMNTEILRQMADECAAGMGRFAGSPRTEAQLAMQLADLYSDLEEPARALPWYRRRWELEKQTEGPRSRAALEAAYELGWRSVAESLPVEAVECLREAADGFEQLPGGADQALLARKEQARALSRAGRHEEAVTLFEQVMAHAGEHLPKLAVWLREQADVLKAAGRLEDAVAVMDNAVAKLPQGDTGQRAYVLYARASLRGRPEHWGAALEASGAHLKTLEQKHGPSHPEVLNALIVHATMSCKLPGCPGGEEAARRAVATAAASGHESRLADAWTVLSEVLRMTSRLGDSEQAVRDAIQELARKKAESWRVLELRRRLGDLLVARGAFEEALVEYETAAKGWFEGTIVGRPREKERLIFGSFIVFWERASKAGSPLADEQALADWRARFESWKAKTYSSL